MGIFTQTVWSFIVGDLLPPVLIVQNNSGFRSSFDRGCLSLWFNFRRNVCAHLFRLGRLLIFGPQFYRK